jgi:ubiquinone/menaquinone biosynthesis C-methylase UbiE
MCEIPLRREIVLGLLVAFFSIPVGALAQESPGGGEENRYEYKRASRDGIGKIYMDREISHVMGHRGAGWLERPERREEERTDLLIENLPIEVGDAVADLGAGTGYFSLPMARLVGDAGTVYAVDIQPEMLAIIGDRAASEGISNIETIRATEKDPGLREGSIDMVLLVDAYHEFEWPWEVMSAIYESLIPGGKVVLIEYRAEDRRIPIKRLHKMSERQARAELEAVGLRFVENGDFLPQQHFIVFEKPPGEPTGRDRDRQGLLGQD